MKQKLLLYLTIVLLLPFAAFSQGGIWTWVKGTSGGTTVYGSQGVPNINNTPGAQYDAANWIDQQGKFWLFESQSFASSGSGNLWSYDPATNMWTWVNGPGLSGSNAGVYGTQGSPSSANHPGGRNTAVSWSDNSGNLWLFGGNGADASGNTGDLNDLWKYNIATNQWTWMSGSSTIGAPNSYGTQGVASSSNMIGGRGQCAGWIDNSNNLWIFGGISNSVFGCYNDLWKYDPVTGYWTWMKGPQGTNQSYSYGTLGVEVASNIPPPRSNSTHLKDPNGNFYFWTGYSAQYDEDFNDVWRYNPTTNNWTWISGTNQMNNNGSYGTICVSNPTDLPMSRWDNPSPQTSSSFSCSKVFLTFGGENEYTEGYTDDLWIFNPQTTLWKWIGGSSGPNAAGNYGTMGVPSPTNSPPSRQGHVQWIDNSGNLWLYSGLSMGSTYTDDMWKFEPDINCVQDPLAGGIQYTLPTQLICTGDSVLLTLSAVSNAYIAPSSAVTWVDTAHAYLHPSASTTMVISGNSICRNNDTAYVTINVAQPGVLTYQLSDSDICRGTPISLYLQGQTNLQITPTTGVNWVGSSSAIINPDSSTTYFLKGLSTACNVDDSTTFHINVTQHAPVSFALTDSVLCNGQSSTLTVQGLSNLLVSPYYASYTIPDSTHVVFDPYYTQLYVVSGQTSCGSTYTDSVNINVLYAGSFNYSLPQQSVCLGDTATLFLYGATSPTIVPSATAAVIDPGHVRLWPDTTTTYRVYSPSQCGGFDSVDITVYVSLPNQLTYSLNPYICGGGGTTIYFYGASNIQITPSASIYYLDPTDAYTYVYPSADTVYTVTATSVCSGPVTANIPVYVVPYPDVQANPPYLCPGDSSLLQLTGIFNAQISPLTGVTWIDSADAILKPLVNTNYTISGLGCYGPYTNTVSMQVVQPGVINYTLSDSIACSGGSILLNVYGCTNPTLNPYTYLYPTGQLNTFYAYLYPYNTTTYTVSGTSACGGQSSSTFTINVVPYFNYNLSSPAVCQGQPDLLTLYNIDGVTISPDSNIVWIDSSFDSSHIMLRPGANTTYVIIGNSCYGQTYNYVDVNVITPGVLNYYLSDSDVCAGSYVELDLYGITNINMTPQPMYSYQIDSTDLETYGYPTTTTTYHISGQSVCGGVVTDDVTINVTPYPSYTFDNPNICAGDSTILTFTGFSSIYNISPTTGVRWIDATHAMVTATTSTSYYVSGYSNCTGTYYLYANLNVYQPGVFNYAISDSNICIGDTVGLYVSGIYNVALSPFNAITYLDSTDEHAILSPTLNTQYTISGQSVCGGTLSQSFNVEVNQLPTYTVSSSNLCNGDSAELIITGLNNITVTPNTSVHWIDATHAWVHPSATTSYLIRGYSACSGNVAHVQSVNVGAVNAAITANNTVICTSDSVQICAQPGASGYHWNNGQTTPCIYTNQAGNYYVTVTGSNNCTAESNHIGISVHPVQPISITQNGDTLRVLNGNSPQWYLNGAAIPNATSNVYIAKEPGQYSVSVTDSNGCVVSSNFVTVGIKEAEQSYFRVYPNPLYQGTWHLDVTNELLGAGMDIVDEQGRIIYSSEITNLHSEIDINTASGVYLLRIHSAKTNLVKKLVKMNY